MIRICMNNRIAVSIFASAVRIPFYKTFLDSLKGTSVPYEVVFAGYNKMEEITNAFPTEGWVTDGNEETRLPDLNFRYIHTANIKPEQCYEIARRHCRGEAIHITADDAEYSPDCIGKAYRYWKAHNDNKLMLSIQTIENRMFCNMKGHRFFWDQPNSPIMAPMFFMDRQLLEDMGGFDRRFVCGQGENEIVCRFVFEQGGRVEVWGDRDNYITLDHYARHGIKRPFAEGYNIDRQVLESSWSEGRTVLSKRKDEFEPFVDDGTLLTKSQSNNLPRWV